MSVCVWGCVCACMCVCGVDMLYMYACVGVTYFSDIITGLFDILCVLHGENRE